MRRPAVIQISIAIWKDMGTKRVTYPYRDVESGYEGNDVQGETNVTANDTELSLEWQFVQGVSLHHPAAAEANMGKTDTAPYEKIGKTGERQEPGEEGRAGRGFVNKGEETKDELDDDTPERATFAVNVHEEFRTHTPCCERLHGTCGAEGTRVCDTKDGYGDDSVEDGGKTADTGHLDGKHEGRSLGICTG